MLDHPTTPMPAITVSRAAVKAIRRQGERDRKRTEDLQLAELGAGIPYHTALAVAARMSARGEDKTLREETALRKLMKRHGLTDPVVRDEQRRQR